jgi:hypothetical protein
MVLIDDPEFRVIEPQSALSEKLTKIYDFSLMLDSGQITGFLVDQPDVENRIISELKNLYLNNQNVSVSPGKGSGVFYAVGDGNHSLATAKAIWEKMKGNVPIDHPARFALVELVNIHDPALIFEPIHRLLTAPGFDCLHELSRYFANKITFINKNDFGSLCDAVDSSTSQCFGITTANQFIMASLSKPLHSLAVGSLQIFLDDLIKKDPHSNLDYIHGAEVLRELSNSQDNFGFFLPSMEKSALFPSITHDGPLPRKTFSMGLAQDKRFYLECRRIMPDA